MKTIINRTENHCQLRSAATRLVVVTLDDRGPTRGPDDRSSDVLFRDPELSWRPVSRRLALEWRLPAIVVGVVGIAAVLVGVLALPSPGNTVLAVVGAVLLAAALAAWVVIGRFVSTWRYAERDQDLLVTRGRIFRRLTVIPYGRMQVIEVSANPISTWLDIATVTLVTASASTDARIPGLPTGEAHALRDRLAARGEAMTAGL
jgi:membrane protein YdbS with pleckstrin-like domain